MAPLKDEEIMADNSNNVPEGLPHTMIEIEGNRSITVPVDQIVVTGHTANNKKVKDLAESISSVGLLSPIVVALRKDQDGGEYQLIAGHHRLQALKLLGIIDLA
jgi:uncharacterized ParB-like nuclease family protein